MLARILTFYFLIGFLALFGCFLGFTDGLTMLTLGIAYVVLPAAALLALGAGMLDRWVSWERGVEFETRSSRSHSGSASPEAAPASS